MHSGVQIRCPYLIGILEVTLQQTLEGMAMSCPVLDFEEELLSLQGIEQGRGQTSHETLHSIGQFNFVEQLTSHSFFILALYLSF